MVSMQLLITMPPGQVFAAGPSCEGWKAWCRKAASFAVPCKRLRLLWRYEMRSSEKSALEGRKIVDIME